MLNEKQNRQKKMRILKSKIFGGKTHKNLCSQNIQREKKEIT